MVSRSRAQENRVPGGESLASCLQPHQVTALPLPLLLHNQDPLPLPPCCSPLTTQGCGSCPPE